MRKLSFIFLLIAVCIPVFAEDFVPAYELGQEGPGGGIVFFISEQGFDVPDGKGNTMRCHYLEVAKEDLKVKKSNEIPFYPKNVDQYQLSKTTKASLGQGKQNTYLIVTNEATLYGKKPKPMTAENCAAMACYKFKTPTTEEGDWFLPSQDELILLDIMICYYIPELRSILEDDMIIGQKQFKKTVKHAKSYFSSTIYLSERLTGSSIRWACVYRRNISLLADRIDTYIPNKLTEDGKFISGYVRPMHAF